MALLKHKANGQEVNVTGENLLWHLTSPYTKGKYNILQMTLPEFKSANSRLLIPGNVIVSRGKDFAVCKRQFVPQWRAMGWDLVGDAEKVEEPKGVEKVEVNATLSAMAILAEHGIDPATVTGTGSGGRITKADAQEAFTLELRSRPE